MSRFSKDIAEAGPHTSRRRVLPDEPTRNLDSALAADVFGLMRRRNREC